MDKNLVINEITDITVFGVKTDNGSEILTVDMGSADILASPYYYLKPNDIVYVEPLKIKQWGFTTFPYSTLLSVISLAATMYALFRTPNNR